MPILKQAKKKMRHDKKVTALNQIKKTNLKGLIKNTRRVPDAKNLTATFSALDKASKTKLIHPNKAARLKSRLSKLIGSPAQ